MKDKEVISNLIKLFEAWRDGIFANSGIVWEKEPPAIIAARAYLDAK